MNKREPLASFEFTPGTTDAALAFLKRTRDELRELRLVRIWDHRLEVVDVNQDLFEIRGVGYVDTEIVPLLDAINTNYNRETIHTPLPGKPDGYKEFKTGRRYPWAHDRVM